MARKKLGECLGVTLSNKHTAKVISDWKALLDKDTMKILITGACGYIGSVLTAYLLEQGHIITALDNLTYSTSGLVANMDKPNFYFLNGDIRNKEDCWQACKKQDVVVHLAAIVGEPACRVNICAESVNVVGTQRLFAAANDRHVKSFIFASTCSNYGQAEQATEEAELNPLGLYAETKVACEKWLLEQRESMSTTILRFATAFGLSSRMRFDLLINQFILDAWEQRKLEVYDKNFWRPFCHVQDISRAIELIINTCPKATNRQVFNVGGFNVTKEMLCNDLSITFPDLEVVYRETGRGRNYSVDFGRIRRLGFVPKRGVDYGIIQVANALRLGVFDNPRKMANVTTN